MWLLFLKRPTAVGDDDVDDHDHDHDDGDDDDGDGNDEKGEGHDHYDRYMTRSPVSRDTLVLSMWMTS